MTRASAAAPRTKAGSRALLAGNNRGGAVKYFMKDMVGAPAPMVSMMRLMPWVWRKLEAVAHTLPYDATIMTRFQDPASAVRASASRS